MRIPSLCFMLETEDSVFVTNGGKFAPAGCKWLDFKSVDYHHSLHVRLNLTQLAALRAEIDRALAEQVATAALVAG